MEMSEPFLLKIVCLYHRVRAAEAHGRAGERIARPEICIKGYLEVRYAGAVLRRRGI